MSIQTPYRNGELESLPNECPYCHKQITPNIISDRHTLDNNVEVAFQCPNPSCKKLFIGVYQKFYQKQCRLLSCNVGTFKSKDFSEEILNVSPAFVKIYNESYFAEQNILLEICGVGYRKALEFLIKDYLIRKFPAKEENIKKKFLGRCIDDDVTDTKIKSVAKRATWLGNDETHYERLWQDKDLSDLKLLITLTVHWIESEILTEAFEKAMQERQKLEG